MAQLVKGQDTNAKVPRSNPSISYEYFSFDFIVILCEEIEIENGDRVYTCIYINLLSFGKVPSLISILLNKQEDQKTKGYPYQ